MTLRHIAARAGLVSFGLLLALVLLEVGMRGAGALIRARQLQNNREVLQQRHEFRILCLGESTTQGTVAYGHYPEMMQEILNQQHLGVGVAVVNQGRSGAETHVIVEQLKKDLETFSPNLVVAMMGINDAGRTHAYGTIIAPGANHWYGSFRTYKLYRMLRATLELDAAPEADEGLIVAADMVGHPPAAKTKTPKPAAPSPAPPPDPAVETSLRRASAHIDHGEFSDAEMILREILSVYPEDSWAHHELARLYAGQGDRAEARRVLARAIALVPHPTDGLYASLAIANEQDGDLDGSIAILRQLIDHIVPADDTPAQIHYRAALATLYEKQRRFDLAEQILLPVVEYDPGNDAHYQVLIDFYERRGNAERAAELHNRQQRVRHEYVNPGTRTNYHKLKEEVLGRGIALVAAQYPMRQVETLRRDLDHDSAVIYADNGFFQQLVARDGYWRYFTDNFGGDFGHLSTEGNYLLAENIARVITEQYFGVEFHPLQRKPADARR